jgi:hypothetical protein
MIVLRTDIMFVLQPGGLQVGVTVIEGRRKTGNGRVTDAMEVGKKPGKVIPVIKIGHCESWSIAGMVVTANVPIEIGKRKVVADLESMKGTDRQKPWIEE